MTNQQDQITLHNVNKYCGGPLAIRSIIYGCPDIRWNLVEDPDSWPITPGLIAWSYNREEVETLMLQLRPNTNLCTLETLPMTNQQHPITPPPELVKKLQDLGNLDSIALAYQAGADQELEACVEWMKLHFHSGSQLCKQLRAARLKEQALSELNLTADPDGAELSRTQVELIRRALEALPND